MISEEGPSNDVIHSLAGKDLLSLDNLDTLQMHALLDTAQYYKAHREARPLVGKILGLLFRKASTRTRVSFMVAMYHLGGEAIDLNPNVTQVGRGESIKDTARVLSRYVDALAIRTFEQAELEEFADYCSIPVINALTDLEHPCQILADLLTMKETFGSLKGLTMAYVGDGNNIVHSLLLGCAKVGMNLKVATPPGYEPLSTIVVRAQEIATQTDCTISLLEDPQEAAKDAHALYTDVWASMGQEEEAEIRQEAFAGYQINDNLCALANAKAIVLHCLPAHRGEEISQEALEGPQSRVWDQAENRLHAQKAILAALLSPST
ncbi:MAG: ornithine carbamoyltransferase [Gloeobacterales cyanobacterium]